MLHDLNAEDKQKLLDYTKKCDKAFRDLELTWSERCKAIERFKIELQLHSIGDDVK